jgi:hypothetical protein
MPIPTASDAWQSAAQSAPLRTPVLELLREHPEQAFHARELADEILDVGWADRVEGKQHRSQPEGTARDGAQATTEAMVEFVGVQALAVVLRDLGERDEVQVRAVRMDTADIPEAIAARSRGRGTVAYYAYAGDS